MRLHAKHVLEELPSIVIGVNFNIVNTLVSKSNINIFSKVVSVWIVGMLVDIIEILVDS